MAGLHPKQNIFAAWVQWHFAEVPQFLFGVWKNYLYFGANYFSIPLLLSTLFSPWRRYRWRYPKGFDLGGYLSTFISNIFSRFVGAFCRIILIFFGIITQLVIAVTGVLMIIGWLFIPLVLLSILFIVGYPL